MILENFLLFTEIPTEKMLQRQIYVQNIQYDVLLRKGGGLRSCAISMMGSEHQSWEPLAESHRRCTWIKVEKEGIDEFRLSNAIEIW